jgi:PAS domain S-box-containing protein
LDFFSQLFTSAGFMPHGHCYLWLPALVWLHAGSDLLIGAAYLLIPGTLVWFYRQRPDVPFRWTFLAFALFILACGMTHLIEVWTVWFPSYWLEGSVKAVTAALSLLTAGALVKLMPHALSIPSPAQWRAEVLERRRVEHELKVLNDELEWRVRARTKEMEAANRALRESEERLRTLVEHAPEAIVVLDLDRGRFSLVNDNACRLFGLSREELLERGPVEVSAPVQPDGRTAAAAAAENLEAAVRGEALVFEWLHRDAQGRDIICEVRLVRLPSSGAPLIRGSILDIAERKVMYTALTESEAKFATIFHNCPEPVSIALWPQGTYVDVNQAYERQFGWTREEVLGRTGLELNLWADPARRADMVRLLERDGRVDDFETEFRCRDGRLWFGRMSAELTLLNGNECIVILLRDVTLQRRAEQELRESRAKYLTVFRTCPESLSISSVDSSAYLEVNDAYQRLFGYHRGEVVGRSALELGIWADPAERFELVRRLERFGRVNGCEVRFRHKDGRTWLGEVSAETVDVGGNRWLVSAVRDVTRQKQVENEIRLLNTQLEERVRQRTAELEVANQELESFSYSVSHDLRAPLRSIHGFGQALREDSGERLTESGQAHLDRIQRAAERMGQLIDDLLHLSRVTRTEILRQPVDLTALARGVVQDLRTAEPNRHVEFLAEEALRGTGDPRLLLVALENLLRNAWKFTSRRDDARIEFGLMPNTSDVYCVRDNGAGFDMAFAPRLFGPFQRLHAAGEFPGTGVGLAIVHRIIRRHGGRIWAEGTVDGGAAFYFTLGQDPRTNPSNQDSEQA